MIHDHEVVFILRTASIERSIGILIMSFIGLLLLAMIMNSENASAEDKVECRYKGGYGGTYEDLVYDDGYLYVAHLQGFSIFDATDPSEPEMVSSTYTPGDAQGIAVSGDHVFVADGYEGIVIYDVTDKTDPQQTGSYDYGFCEMQDIVVEGDLAYLATGFHVGLIILDVSDKTDPVMLGFVGISGTATEVTIVGNIAYVGSWDRGLEMVDISNKNDPWSLGEYSTGYTLGLAVSGNHAFLADNSEGLVILYVDDPGDPVKQGEYTDVDSWGIAIEGDLVYLGCGFSGVKIIDVSSRSNPELVGELPDVWGGAITVFGDYAYICSGPHGLSVIDISNNAKPVEVGRYSSAATLEDVYVAGEFAYLANGRDGLVILDIESKTEPLRIGACDTPGWAYEAIIDGDYAYIADGEAGLSIIDISNLADPQLIGTNNFGGKMYGLAIHGDHAFCAAGKNGLQIIDISNKTDPQLIRRYNPGGSEVAYGVAILENYAYLAYGGYGLSIIDISEKTNPLEVGRYGTSYDAMGVDVMDDHAYLAVMNDGLIVVDVTDKTEPTRAGRMNTAGYSKDVAVLGGFVYLADWWEGLVIGDVQDMSNPNVQQAGWTQSYEAHGVFAAGENIYLADGNNGFLIFELAPVAKINMMLPNPAIHGDEITFEGQGYCKYDRDIEQYVWISSIDGELFSSDSSNFTSNALSSGTHTISLQVLDSEGLWGDSFSQPLTVYERPIAEIVSIIPDPVLEGEPLFFNGSSVNNVTIVRYVWRNETKELYNNTNSTFNYSNLSIGNHIIYLKVLDNNNIWSEEVHKTVEVLKDTDFDRVPDITDAFPEDPAASKDTDGDGFPDEWNFGKGADDSTSFLSLDSFPSDAAASKDTDGDGYPDEWNTGKTDEDSTTGLNLDEFPDDPEKWKKEKNDSSGFEVFVTLVILIGCAFVLKKKS